MRPDRYRCFADLKDSENPDSYWIAYEGKPHCGTLIMAPHGGKIEMGTSEIAKAIAGDDRSLYLFEGRKAAENWDLHIKSTNFDEPIGLRAAEAAELVVTIHGQSGPGEFINVGGKALLIANQLIAQLSGMGYSASRHTDTDLQGLSDANICNRGKSGEGVQLELSKGFRIRMLDEQRELTRFSDIIRSVLTSFEDRHHPYNNARWTQRDMQG